ncbi:MAG: transcription-repair coupling factor [Bacteroidaceae bacterium]|nr:transcription-repair coupling factor [Bacteroidaceae bacterium]
MVDGLIGSSAALVFTSVIRQLRSRGLPCPRMLFILEDEEEAGYFYHDLTQTNGEQDVLFFPSSYRNTMRSDQRDSANEILRTDVLTDLNTSASSQNKVIVSFPEAIKEPVVSQTDLTANSMILKVGETYETADLESFLFTLGFIRVDYVYEPGQFAIRGSIIDIFSFSSEIPYRIDFFGDEIDSIRTFDIQTQLSDARLSFISIVPEIDSLKSEQIPFTDFLPKNTLVVMRDRQFVENRSGLSFDGFRTLIISQKSSGSQQADVRFSTSRQPLFHKNFDLMRDEFTRLEWDGYKIFICADNDKQHKRLKEIFPELHFRPIEKALHAGFTDHDQKTCFFTDHQIFDRYHKYSLKSDKVRRGKMVLTLKELQQFEPGDYVVHIDHGVGKFGGLVRVPENGVMQEKIMITYKNDDTVYVSIHALHKLSKYKGKEGVPPTLSSLGTGAWQRMKERVKAKVKDIARDLIQLYAERQKEQGFAFGHDDYMQHELESSFMYEDTPDQLKATQDVKADMERIQPMDRLVCGDVGFGKTEVAIRAAFKAAANGKQVAVLVPTTVLAYQHWKIFSERLKDFPVKVEYLSRARTATQTKAVLEDLAEGKIDIIIGTHKLIGKAVKFKDLGLLVIDEEQKFGVAAKEKLRQMKVNVDTLTMTATPIPRTLQFSLMGARDLSIIQTPPTNRYPIQTEVHTFSEEVIRDAINFEMSRNGQVFFVNNKISNLPELEMMIHRCVPDARVCIAHGRTNPAELEQVVFDFMNYDYDVLLSTTIVENGIDIPNANTIIINSAQHYGLSDLHQMRGRVGRSNKKAFCYLIAPPLSALKDDARRRLQALETFSDLGMGMQIALQDLDIRGAGNLLGAEQSGFIADLGYETYQKVLKEAMQELNAEEFSKSAEASSGSKDNEEVAAYGNGWRLASGDVTVESDLPTYFHETFVPTSGERISLYRELDTLETEEQLCAYKSRLTDRFGEIPEEAQELINIMPLKWMAARLGVEKITLKQSRLILHLISDFTSDYYRSDTFGQLIRYLQSHTSTTKLRDGQTRSLLIRDVPSVSDALAILKQMEKI